VISVAIVRPLLSGLGVPDPGLNQAAGSGWFGLDLVTQFLFQRPGTPGFLAGWGKVEAG
jgi:hypothetical protein